MQMRNERPILEAQFFVSSGFVAVYVAGMVALGLLTTALFAELKSAIFLYVLLPIAVLGIAALAYGKIKER